MMMSPDIDETSDRGPGGDGAHQRDLRRARSGVPGLCTDSGGSITRRGSGFDHTPCPVLIRRRFHRADSLICRIVPKSRDLRVRPGIRASSRNPQRANTCCSGTSLERDEVPRIRTPPSQNAGGTGEWRSRRTRGSATRRPRLADLLGYGSGPSVPPMCDSVGTRTNDARTVRPVDRDEVHRAQVMHRVADGSAINRSMPMNPWQISHTP